MTWRHVGRIAAGVVAAFVAAELTVRFIYFQPLIYDPTLGNIHVPGVVVQNCLEGCAKSTFRTGGLRRSEDPESGGFKILTIGDSFTEALQVEDEDTYASQLEARLSGAPAPVQVLNVGYAAFSIADLTALAAVRREQFGPDWTVIQLGSGDFTSDAWSRGGPFAKYVLDDSGTPTLEPPHPRERSPRIPLFGELYRRSAILQLGLLRWSRFSTAENEPPLFRAGDLEPSAQHAGERPWERAGVPARMLDDLVHAYGSRVTVLFLPKGSASGSLEPPDSIELEVDQYCRDTGISCINAREAFERLREEARAPLGFPNSVPFTGHLNELGHATVAALLAHELQRRSILP